MNEAKWVQVESSSLYGRQKHNMRADKIIDIREAEPTPDVLHTAAHGANHTLLSTSEGHCLLVLGSFDEVTAKVKAAMDTDEVAALKQRIAELEAELATREPAIASQPSSGESALQSPARAILSTWHTGEDLTPVQHRTSADCQHVAEYVQQLEHEIMQWQKEASARLTQLVETPLDLRERLDNLQETIEELRQEADGLRQTVGEWKQAANYGSLCSVESPAALQVRIDTVQERIEALEGQLVLEEAAPRSGFVWVLKFDDSGDCLHDDVRDDLLLFASEKIARAHARARFAPRTLYPEPYAVIGGASISEFQAAVGRVKALEAELEQVKAAALVLDPWRVLQTALDFVTMRHTRAITEHKSHWREAECPLRGVLQWSGRADVSPYAFEA
jgi:DNA repair exonuclease SbcCD ATPase subunit